MLPIDPLELLDTPRAAARYGLAPDTFLKWRKAGKGPPYVRLAGGRSVRYRTCDLEAWLSENTVTPSRKSGTPATKGTPAPHALQRDARLLAPHLRGARPTLR